jgi:competence protein ComEC
MAICYSAGIYVAFLFKLNWMSWVGFFMCFLCALLILGKERRAALVFFCCICAGMISLNAGNTQSDEITKLANHKVELQGEVVSVSHKNDHDSITVSSSKYGLVLINLYQKNQKYKNITGKWIWASGFLELPQTSGNPRGFDYRLYLRSIGVFSIMHVQPDQLTYSESTVNPIAHKLAAFRLGFEEKLSQKLGKKQTGLALAMLFGDKSALEDEIYESFQRNGTAHILSVSGLHVGFLYSLLTFFLLGKRRPIPNIAVFTMLVAYGMLSGFCPSVTRALMMIGIHILSKVLCRSYDLLSATGISAFIILAQNPYSLFHVGFQLSFLAVIVMGWVFPIIKRLIPKEHILSLILPIPALQIAMAPYTAFLFNYVSFGAFVANFGVVFFSGILIPAGLLAMFASHVSDSFFELMAIFMELCIRCVLWCNELTYADGKTCMDVISPPVLGLVVAYCLFFFFLSETGRILCIRKKYKAIAWVLILCISSAGLVGWKTEHGFDKADAVFVDVGQGDCLHIRTPSGKNVLIDGGGKDAFDVGKRVLKPYLLKNGVSKIDLAVVTHLDIDHFGGISSLSEDGMVDTLGLYAGNRLIENEMMKDTGLAQDQFLYLQKGDRVSVDQVVWLEVLYPEKKSHQAYETEIQAQVENQRSLVIRVHLGKYRILMTGDIDIQTENEVIGIQKSSNLQAEILKIGHHGSKYSTSDNFLHTVEPQVAVFLTGKNNYGHPDASVLEKCRQKGIMIYRTDKNGAIGMFGFYKDQNPYFRTIKKGN